MCDKLVVKKETVVSFPTILQIEAAARKQAPAGYHIVWNSLKLNYNGDFEFTLNPILDRNLRLFVVKETFAYVVLALDAAAAYEKLTWEDNSAVQPISVSSEELTSLDELPQQDPDTLKPFNEEYSAYDTPFGSQLSLNIGEYLEVFAKVDEAEE